MPAIMEQMCMEVVDGESGEFNWEVLDEPPPEEEDEMGELDALLTSWEPAEPSHQSKDKGKGKPTVEVVKVEGSLESGKAKGQNRGQKRKAEVAGEEGKEAKRNGEGSKTAGAKKAKTQAQGNSAGPAPAHNNEDA